MTMLIKGGVRHTMTEQGTFIGDVLMQDGRIADVAPMIELPPDVQPCTLSAAGLHVLPGLIDAHIRECPENDAHLLHTARAAGITSGLVWPDDEGPCRLMTADGLQDAGVHLLRLDGYADEQLIARMNALHVQGTRPAVEAASCEQCRRILTLAEAAHIPVLLAHLQGCDALAEEIAASGCGAILGVARGHSGSPWALAAQLDALGAAVAVSCNHPNAALKHLPVCAALCVRDGLPRERALRLITTGPASLLGIADAGRIRPGDRADLTLYDGDPLLLATGHVITIQGGKICC